MNIKKREVLYQTQKFLNLPKHQDLLNRAITILVEDERVKGLYLSGSLSTDIYSDIDLVILSSEHDRTSLEHEQKEIAMKVGKIKSEAIAGVPHTYVVFYEPEEIKLDFCFRTIPETRRPDKVFIEILYDPEGEIKQLVDESAKLSWDIDTDFLRNKIKHFYIGISYTMTKIARGELWDSKDCIDFYCKYLMMFEDIVAKRKQEGYRRLEQKIDKEKLELLENMLLQKISRQEILRAFDIVITYFDKYLKNKFQELGVFPTEYATKMIEYYNRKKNEIIHKE